MAEVLLAFVVAVVWVHAMIIAAAIVELHVMERVPEHAKTPIILQSNLLVHVHLHLQVH